jgi:hypothetical protein
MMESSLATRTYTEQQIKPLVNGNDPAFHPQIVKSATEHFNYFRVAYSEYSYKEATLNPTNPRDHRRAVTASAASTAATVIRARRKTGANFLTLAPVGLNRTA